MIEVEQLSKRFGPVEVLSDVSLSVARGEVAVIVGPSGGGKSTLLRCLNGLTTFDAGVIRIAGVELRAEASPRELRRAHLAVRRKVGMVFQQFHLFPHRTALGNVIEAPIHVLRRPRSEAVAHAQELLARVGLAEKADQMPDALSGGQQQRVAIARSLAMRPDVLLFDEPTSALDPRMAAEVEAVIADLAASGQTMVVVTHSMLLARRAAHRVHVMAAGRIVESGPPERVFGSPQTAEARALLEEATPAAGT